MLQMLGREGNRDFTAPQARGPKGLLTIYLTPLCQPRSACRFSKIYLLLLGGGLGIVMLMIVNLFSSLLHCNTDLSQRGKPLPTTSSSHIEILTQLSFFLFFFFFRGGSRECCWPYKESFTLLKIFEKEDGFSLKFSCFLGSRTSPPLKEMKKRFL